ncbi:MAG: C39 family peptidase [Lentisphaeria bacterium]|nr:C39 family peptidase [Lentisphaeria bacterium]NQZ70974.1 C39 family peptidase [Lentisphaeria bacterium]
MRKFICLLMVQLLLAAESQTVVIKSIPHIKQKPDFCGEACVAMLMQKLGYKNVTQDMVFNKSWLSPLEGRGCYTRELKVAIQGLGFKTGKIFHTVKAGSEQEINEEWLKLYGNLKKGISSIVCMHYNDQPNTTEHFRLIVGYDPKKDEVIYHEPALAKSPYKRMSLKMFKKLWPLKYDKKKWSLIRFTMDPANVKKQKPDTGFTNADYAQEVMRLKKLLPKNFSYVIEKPFLIVGDENSMVVQQRSKRTVAWATAHLKKSYFAKDPKKLLTIYLFKDKASYRKYCWKLWRDKPTTPYGYYSSANNALVMNIATGGGTLVHEMVHPFMEANFDECPAWFNEGLASLYEQSGRRNGQIVGFTNWRLKGLKTQIKGGLMSFKKLLSTSSNQFYGGNNYAQARYLCYYLQEKKLLRKYYKSFVKNAKKDPSGYDTLVTILGAEGKDMVKFQKAWELWISKLVYR